MTHLEGPLFSERAKASLAKVLTFSHQHNRNSLKHYAKPKDPKTPKQISIRAMSAWVSSRWKYLSAPPRSTWDQLILHQAYAPYHAYVKFNMQRWRTFRSPTETYPPRETGPGPTVPGIFGYAHRLAIYLAIYWAPAIKPAGFTVHQSTSAPLSPAFDNLVKVVQPSSATATYAWIQVPAPATYYWRVRAFGHSGGWGQTSTTFSLYIPD